MSIHHNFGPNKKMKLKYNSLFLIILCFLFTPALSIAGSFKVSPVKLYFDSRTKATVIKITNNNDERVTVQLDAKEWSQNETGPEIFKQSKDIVFFPRIVTIEKGEERIIRLGYQGNKSLEAEKTYRLFIEELPVTEPGETVLKFALRIGIPIFISPLKEFKEASIEKLQFSDGKLEVKVKNNGNVHFLVGKITAMGVDNLNREVFKTEGKGWYVLAGVARTFDIEITEKDCIKANKVKVTVEVKRTIMKKDLILDKTQCFNKKEDEKIRGGKLNK